MKQVEEALARAFAGRPPAGKCRAQVAPRGRYVAFWHYHHLLLVYDLELRVSLHAWHETPTARRILAAALRALAARDPPDADRPAPPRQADVRQWLTAARAPREQDDDLCGSTPR